MRFPEPPAPISSKSFSRVLGSINLVRRRPTTRAFHWGGERPHDTRLTLSDGGLRHDPDRETRRAEVERSPLVELSPQEAMALIQIANAGGIRAGAVSESDVSRLHLLGLVEQRGMSMGLTSMGIQAIARLKQG
jgi:hypothetical protein